MVGAPGQSLARVARRRAVVNLTEVTQQAVAGRKGDLASGLHALVVAASRVETELVLVEVTALGEVLVTFVAPVGPLVLMDALVVL